MFDSGVNVNIADHAGWTPLHEACNHGSIECLLELLKFKPPKTIDSYFSQGMLTSPTSPYL